MDEIMRAALHLDPTIPITKPFSLSTSFYPEFKHYSPTNLQRPSPFMYKNNTYFSDKKLGEGAYGITWLFKSPAGKKVVVKIEKPNEQGLYNLGPDFENEALINKIMYSVGDFSGDRNQYSKPHFIILDFIPGFDIISLLSKRGENLNPSLLLRIWVLLAIAFHQLHQAGFLHCDAHCKNILVSPGIDIVFLIDFGLSKRLGELRTDCNRSPKEHMFSPHLPPENFQGKDTNPIYSHTSQDAYSLGYHLNKFIFHARLITRNRPLKQIADALMDKTARKRMSIPAAISDVISLCFFSPIQPLSHYLLWLTVIFNLLHCRLALLQRSSVENRETNELLRLVLALPQLNDKQKAPDECLCYAKILLAINSDAPLTITLAKNITAAFFNQNTTTERRPAIVADSGIGATLFRNNPININRLRENQVNPNPAHWR